MVRRSPAAAAIVIAIASAASRCLLPNAARSHCCYAAVAALAACNISTAPAPVPVLQGPPDSHLLCPSLSPAAHPSPLHPSPALPSPSAPRHSHRSLSLPLLSIRSPSPCSSPSQGPSCSPAPPPFLSCCSSPCLPASSSSCFLTCFLSST